MNRLLISFGTAAVLTVGMAGAAYAADRYASPSQPVPYSQLNTYMKAGASKRAAILAQNTDAAPAANAGVNSSATMPATATPDTPTAAPVNAPGATTPTPAPAPANNVTPAPAPMPSANNPPATPAGPATPPMPQ